MLQIIPREPTFQEELSQLINRYSLENGSNTPDFLLALYLQQCLSTFNDVMRKREDWYGRRCSIGGCIDLHKQQQERATNALLDAEASQACDLGPRSS
ncbi:MAG: hypothetical protein WC919_00765 [Candidatus Paceibacterota bacterium]|jgi:hypothetical protein